MKINLFSLALLFTFAAPSAHAKFFACKAVAIKLQGELTETTLIPTPKLDLIPEGKGHDIGLVVPEDMVALCKSGGSYYQLSALGFGATLHFNNNYFTFSCPLVSKKRFNQPGGAVFGGVRVSATAIAGLDVGLYSNHALGVCALSGVTLGVGASATAGVVRVEKIEKPVVDGTWMGDIFY